MTFAITYSGMEPVDAGNALGEGAMLVFADWRFADRCGSLTF